MIHWWDITALTFGNEEYSEAYHVYKAFFYPEMEWADFLEITYQY